MTVKSRIDALRVKMNETGIDGYIIPSEDFHQSEYVSSYFKSREYISGFTGSAGKVLVTKETSILWTDGRYFIQAEKQLAGSGMELYKMGQPGVLTMEEYLQKEIKEGSTIGFDGRIVNANLGESLETLLKAKNIKIDYSHDLVGKIWEDRPSLPAGKVFLLDEKFAGKSAVDKITELRASMKAKETTTHIITSLDDIAWLLNIRGADVTSSPVVLSYVIVDMNTVTLYVDQTKLNDEVISTLTAAGVQIKDYFEVYEEVKKIDEKEVVLVDKSRVNYAAVKDLNENIKTVNAINPTTFAKASKNPIEIENTRNAHIKDGVAVTKFMYWLKKNVGKGTVTELDAAAKMLELRQEQADFIEPSFNSIAAVGSNAAMMHYSATEESFSNLEEGELFLLDSGGIYFDGTTDITRTFALGNVSDLYKRDFTLVLKGVMRLSAAKFMYGATGTNLDVLARGILWEYGIDYKCGTGHGIGHVLNVHEGPQGIRMQWNPHKLEEGMIITNEPGVYVEGSHGIRLENEIVVRKTFANEHGQFMDFENITFAPMDLDAIDKSIMTGDEVAMLNDYHAQVFNKLAPHLDETHKEWLKEYTRAI